MRSQLEKEFSFHIPQKNQPYFEGWYVRIHTNSLDFAVIFGLSLSTKKDVFIQYLDSHCSKVYHYSWHELTFTIEPFCIQIAGNYLSLDQLKLALPEIKATLDFDQLIPLKISRYAPTIMGPFAYFPMECIHSIISLHHNVTGFIEQNGFCQEIQGIGYIEKDRGTSFPSHYVWFQSNQNKQAPCFFFSYAHIPFGFLSFQGCICVLLLEKQYRFATYLGCRVKVFNKERKIVLKQYPYTLIIDFSYPHGHTLHSPKEGIMCGRVNETLQAQATVTLFKKKYMLGKYRYTHGGFENYHIF